jgi:ADP-heptose:LPS heptosyltransferase
VLFRKSQSLAQKNGYRLIHVDMLIHSYAEHQTKKRMIWKSGGHAMQVIAKNFKASVKDPLPELYFTLLEAGRVKEFIDSKIGAESYIVVEPGTNKDWFGDLRSWPMDRWQELVYHIKKTYPKLLVLQVGLTDTQLLEGVVDLRGRTSFREAALVIKNSSLFIGTEGGLMHAAAAVNAPSLILWGGITLPSFAGYQNHQKILSNFVSCAPCGQLGWCDNDNICMKSIETYAVNEQVNRILHSSLK